MGTNFRILAITIDQMNTSSCTESYWNTPAFLSIKGVVRSLVDVANETVLLAWLYHQACWVLTLEDYEVIH